MSGATMFPLKKTRSMSGYLSSRPSQGVVKRPKAAATVYVERVKSAAGKLAVKRTKDGARRPGKPA
jgi:hypothetical protein